MLLVLILVFGIHSSIFADTLPSERWDNLMNVAYKFSWYPKQDLVNLLETKSVEYGQSLEEYCRLLITELTNRSTNTGLIPADAFVSGKHWKTYCRLAVAQFCLFLTTDSETHLENAKSTLSILSGKKELPVIAFWHYLFQACDDLAKKDRNAFVASVFHIWQDVILKLEIVEMRTGSKTSQTEFVKSLPFLYENVAHVIISRGIIKEAVPDLYSLSVIIISLKDKLSSQNGYKDIVNAIAERMHGLKSDNYNLNFAAAFVEATASQYEFVDETDSSQIASKYYSTRTYYELALSCSDTRKGKAAILTQYMGLINHILRRLIDKDPLLAGNSFFRKVSGEGGELVNRSLGIYEYLAHPSVQNGGFIDQGFTTKKNYIDGMHQLWDSSAKLLIIMAAYYKSQSTAFDPEQIHPIETPLLEYLSVFRKYAGHNSEIIPDCAFFTAAHAASRLADLYRQASKYSTKIEFNDLALAYQLQAVELFPMDISGILQLAHQTNQEDRLNMYLRYVSPLAYRFRNSKITNLWLKRDSMAHKESIAILRDVIPDLMDNAYYLVKFLQHSENSEEELYQKTILMTKHLMALQKDHSEQVIENTLSWIAKQDFSETGDTMNQRLEFAFPEELQVSADAIPGIDTKYFISRLKNELYGSTDNPVHSYLRELYYEIPHDQHPYCALLKKVS